MALYRFYGGPSGRWRRCTRGRSLTSAFESRENGSRKKTALENSNELSAAAKFRRFGLIEPATARSGFSDGRVTRVVRTLTE